MNSVFITIRLSLLIVVSLFLNHSFAQSIPGMTAKFIDEPIKLDGVMDEEVWQTAGTAEDFWQYFPTDSVTGSRKTQVKIIYDETTLYVGINAQSKSANFMVSSLRRDFSGGSNDNVSIMFDTFSDGANAFLFGVTPYGVQREVLISEGGIARGFNPTWDMKWRAESTIHADHFVVEMAIPFTSIKFKEGATKWRMQAYRWDFQTNEQSAWARVPQNQLLSNLAFMGELNFEKPLGKSRTPIAVIPYINGLGQVDYSSDEQTGKFTYGGDAKIAIGDGLNLDLTFIPDFSNVEVDDIFTNLTRFEVQLPEKRQFFIDNSDLFSSFGNYFNEARPFFSRRIGLARDTAGNLIQNNIIGGARLSGKLNPNWRIGFLNIQTGEDASNEIPSNNNTMFAIQRKVFARSSVGAFVVNRETIGDYEYLETEDRFNRVIGADYNISSADNIWNGKVYMHKSFQPGDTKGNLSSQATVTYNTRYWSAITDWVHVDEGFRSDLGFIPRNDIIKAGNSIARNFYPNSQFFNQHSIRLLAVLYWRPGLGGKRTDHRLSATWETNFKNQASARVRFTNNFIYLTEDFDPTRKKDGTPLPGLLGYYFNQATFAYESNQAQQFSYSFESTLGEFYNGYSQSHTAVLNARMPPYANVGVAVQYDRIRLPGNYEDADLWLITPKFEITFSKSLFWNTLIQYSNQRDNLGINSRLQWRYAPLSDLYLVYNDNYYTSDPGPKFRSINLKLTYWFNPS